MLLVPWTAVVVTVAPAILICKRHHVFDAAATAQEEAYLASVCLGRIFGKYPSLSQALDWMLGWQVHLWEALIATA